ncbi:MAG: glycosyltransferase family 4 protein [Pirellulales bacterium]|nr:glycosyltransferase family 4 protein [Pirellulales bacterium]
MPKLLWLLEYPTVNGGERSLAAAAPWVRAAGFDLAAVVPEASDVAALLRSLGVRVVELVADAMTDGARQSQAERRARLVELFTAEAPDLVVANSLSMARLTGPVTREMAIAAGGHLRDIVGLSPAAVADINCLDRLWAVSQAACDFHVGQGVSADKLRVAYNGIDLEHFRPRPRTGSLAAELGLPRETRFLGTIGQLVQRKGVDVVLDGFLQIAGELPDWHLVMVGERYSQKDEARVFERALHERAGKSPSGERVHFLGRRDDVDMLLPEFDLLVHAARQEPLGRVLLEAAACGVPIVATDVGGTPEIFSITDRANNTLEPGAACELVPPGDVAAFAAALRRLAGDPEQRERMRVAARGCVQAKFDIRLRGPAIAAEYHDLLRPNAAVENSSAMCYNNKR